MNSNSVLVVGAGVSGLTCALLLKNHGYDVTVVAENFAPHVTSVVAGALWEWPPAVCGQHQDPVSINRSKEWCLKSYQQFASLARDDRTGVFLRPVTFYFKEPLEQNPLQLTKMNELAEHVDQFIHDAALIARNQVNPASGVCDAYSHVAPMVDTDVYMNWLLSQVREAGCQVVCERISGNLREQEGALLDRFAADALVHCTGLGARELTNDEMYPLRGAIVRLRNDGRSMPRITEAHCVSHDGKSTDPSFIFVVPRGRDMLILGGLAEPNEWDLGIGFDNYEPIRTMYRRCVEFLPILKAAEVDTSEPVRVGLRPFRWQQVRLEHESGTRIIHNYGHGGSGVTLSWGCAAEVVDLVDRLLGRDSEIGGARDLKLTKSR
jgi:D-amino-acid oxidase